MLFGFEKYLNDFKISVQFFQETLSFKEILSRGGKIQANKF